MSHIAWFTDIRLADVATVGGKGANLGELTAAGLPVPPGFVVTASAYLAAIDASGRAREAPRDPRPSMPTTTPPTRPVRSELAKT